MPNGEGKPWVPRRPNNDVLWKLLGVVFVPILFWLAATVVGHSEELASRGATIDRAESDQEQAESDRHEISKKVERVEERVDNYQRANDSAHIRQERKLDTIIERLNR